MQRCGVMRVGRSTKEVNALRHLISSNTAFRTIFGVHAVFVHRRKLPMPRPLYLSQQKGSHPASMLLLVQQVAADTGVRGRLL
jgi:hypothetical protein